MVQYWLTDYFLIDTLVVLALYQQAIVQDILNLILYLSRI